MAKLIWKASYKDLLGEFKKWRVSTEIRDRQNDIRQWLTDRLAADHPNLAESSRIRYFNYSILKTPAHLKFYFSYF